MHGEWNNYHVKTPENLTEEQQKLVRMLADTGM